MNAFFLIFTLVLLGSMCIYLFIRSIIVEGSYQVPYWNLATKICGGLLLLSLLCMPFAVRNWTHESNEYRSALLQEGIKFTNESIPYNTPTVLKKIIIKDGSDLIYYQILDK
jgi:uncharacterized membrane protein YedE/YeeE